MATGNQGTPPQTQLNVNFIMKRYAIAVCILILAACTSEKHASQQPVTPAYNPSQPVNLKQKFEVVYRQQAYKTALPLKWRTVKDPSLGKQPDWPKLNQIQSGMNAETVKLLLGTPWYQENIYINEWNYLYRYPFNGNMQQCQYKIVFRKNRNQVESVFWEPVGAAHCKH